MRPEDRLFNEIDRSAQHLRGVIRHRSTESVVGTCLMKNVINEYRPPGLKSPAKQILFLLGILVESPEPADPLDLNDDDWEKLLEPLENAFDAYMNLYLPSEGSLIVQSEQWHRSRQVASGAFMSYFNQTLLVTPEQTSERIKKYLTKFDAQLSQDLGISASSALDIAWWAANTLQDDLDRFQDGFAESAPRIGKIISSELIDRFGSEGEQFWRLFTVGRGEGHYVNYPTERTMVEERPLIRISDDKAMFFNVHALFAAILFRGEECLANGSLKRQFFTHRDKTAEDEAAAAFKRILGDDSQVQRNLFETNDSQHEHDMIVFNDELCLLVEVKASPPPEPFRDPERAFTRLNRAFRSDLGIQGAYNQIMKLMRVVLACRPLTLYDRWGNEALQLPGGIAERTFSVCVTRDNHGPLATLLSLLLEKADSEPYPWSVNIPDLQNLAEAWEYFRWDARQLRAYLSERTQLHENVFSHDELDFAGAFVQHCGLQHLRRGRDTFTQLDPTYSDIFDEIHGCMFYGTRAVRINPVYPANADLRESIIQGQTVIAQDFPKGPIKVRRNDVCPCGSNVKFKRCHGK